MSIDEQTKIGQIASEHPLATRVFARHGLDYCCGGGAPLAEACARRGLDTETVLGEIRHELSGPDARQESWAHAPLDDLIDHILTAYHERLREELPRLDGMARKVLTTHGEKDPERLGELVAVLSELRAELEDHMLKEEEVLFPIIQRGQGAMADGPIAMMEHEHDSAATALSRLRELTDDFQPPADACVTWRALWAGLSALEEGTHRHIHLENNILFPRALASAPPA